LQLPAGGITALVGPNGAGKSTLLTMIGRLLALDSGSVHIGQMDVTSSSSKDLAKVVSILRQENHFVTRLTVRQLVGFGRFPYS
ncbi:ATP-binding cassette domain-containing protein, partial [Mycobacterium tuberculosis]|nr:ATP-binding cassette domain-containing protein [Mycobacterium tuberculosis]